MNNTNIIHLGLAASGKLEKGSVIFTLTQGNVIEYYEQKISQLENWRWVNVPLKFNFKKFKNGPAILGIKGKNIDAKTSVSILLTNGVQKIPLENVTINGVKQKGMYLVFSYNLFSFYSFFKNTLWILAVELILLNILNFVKSLFLKYSVAVVAVSLCVYRYLYYRLWERELDGWITTPYILNYEYGLISKALPGQILSFFTDYISGDLLRVVFTGQFIVFIGVYLIFYYKVYNYVNKRQKGVLDILCYLYMSSPFFITFYMGQWGRHDVTISILFIISIYILCFGNKDWQIWLIILLSTLAVLTHQIFVFTLYPAIFGLLLYKIVVNKEIRKIPVMILNCVVPAFFALFIQFWGKPNCALEEMLTYMRSRTDTYVLDAMVCAEYYIPTAENAYVYGTLDAKASYRNLNIGITLIILSPLLYLLVDFWRKSICRQDKKESRIITIMIALIPFASIPMFMTISDGGRIFVLLVLEEMVLILALWLCDEAIFGTSIMEIYDGLVKKYGNNIFFVLIIYLFVIGTCGVGNILLSDFISGIQDYIVNIQLKAF